MLKLFQKIICCLMVSSSLSIFANIEEAQSHQIDSLKKLITINEPNTDKVDLLNTLAVHQIVSSKYDSAKVSLEKSILLSKQLVYKVGEANAYSQLAKISARNGDRLRAMNLINNSIEIHQEVNNILGEANSLCQKGLNLSHLQKKEEAIQCLNDALSIYKSLDNQNGIANVYGCFGFIYDDDLNTAKSLDYYLKCINIKESLSLNLDQEIHLSNAYGNLALSYSKQKKLDKYYKYFELALQKMNKIGDLANASIVNIVRAFVEFQLGQYDKTEHYALKSLELGKKANYDYSIGYAYFMLAELQSKAFKVEDKNNLSYLDSAFYLYEQQKLICDKISNKDGLIRSLQGMAEICFLKNEFPQAIALYEKSDSIAKIIASFELQASAQKGISKAYAKTNNYKKAFLFKNNYISIDEIIRSEEKAQAIQKIESENELRQIKERERKEIEALNSRNFLQYSAILAVLIFLLLFFNFLGTFNFPITISKIGWFITLIICFEFILVFLDPYVDSYTGGSPLFKLLINVFVAAFIYPLQNILERKMKK